MAMTAIGDLEHFSAKLANNEK